MTDDNDYLHFTGAEPVTLSNWSAPPPTITFARGDLAKPILTIDMTNGLDIRIGEGVTLTEAAEHFLAECRRLVGAVK